MSEKLCSCGACVEMAGKPVYAPGGAPLVWKPDTCPDCGDDVSEPGSRVALEAEVARLRAELEKHQPEMTYGACGCGWSVWCTDRTDIPLIGWHSGRFVTSSRPCGLYCDQCGDMLDRNGTARRNADTARVARVRDALGMLEPADDLTECGDQTYYNGVWAAIEAVGAALDPPADPEVPDE